MPWRETCAMSESISTCSEISRSLLDRNKRFSSKTNLAVCGTFRPFCFVTWVWVKSRLISVSPTVAPAKQEIVQCNYEQLWKSFLTRQSTAKIRQLETRTSREIMLKFRPSGERRFVLNLLNTSFKPTFSGCLCPVSIHGIFNSKCHLFQHVIYSRTVSEVSDLLLTWWSFYIVFTAESVSVFKPLSFRLLSGKLPVTNGNDHLSLLSQSNYHAVGLFFSALP